MRLGQIARKYNISQEKIIHLLEDMAPGMGPFHHNSKLSEHTEELIARQFSSDFGKLTEDKPIEKSDLPEVVDEGQNDSTIESNATADEEKSEAALQQELDPSLPPIKTVKAEVVDEDDNEQTITSDQLLEILENEDSKMDLSGIKRIKAPKKELQGLKVVGKIDLPEPKRKSQEASKQPVELDDSRPSKRTRHQHSKLSDEEKEERRLKAKEKKEQYEARQEKRRVEEEKKKRKAQNKARYEEKMQKAKASQAKQKMQKEEVEPEVNDQFQAPKPKSIFGKLWRWFNS